MVCRKWSVVIFIFMFSMTTTFSFWFNVLDSFWLFFFISGKILWRNQITSDPVIPSPTSYAFAHCADPQHVKKSVKLNNSPMTHTPGGLCIWLWTPLVEQIVCFHAARDSCVSSERPLQKRVKWSKPLQLPWQAEQPCGKRAVFATDFYSFTTGLHGNLFGLPVTYSSILRPWKTLFKPVLLCKALSTFIFLHLLPLTIQKWIHRQRKWFLY